MTHWTDAGFGTDPEGDARRRAELESSRPSAALVAHLTSADRLGLLAGEVVEGEVVDDEVLVSEPDPHAIPRTPYPWGVAWVCACGRWEGVATGPSSAAWCEREYGRHRRDEESASRGD